MRWLTDRLEWLVGRVVATMPADRRAWGEAVLAEFAAIEPGRRRALWVWGAFWFVLRHRANATRVSAPVGWVSRGFAALGIVTLLPWVFVSIQNLRDDAPDGTIRSMVVLLVARVALVAAFAATWWRWGPARPLLVLSLVGYAASAAFAAADNGGSPVLAALVFVVVPACAATPILIGGARGLR